MRNLFRAAYFTLRPYFPKSVRVAVRRRVARRARNAFPGSWPINPIAAKPPENWAGWPDGKKFAFVLTHDVEGTKGLDRCLELADLEIRAGFRSSFNFAIFSPITDSKWVSMTCGTTASSTPHGSASDGMPGKSIGI
jgi:hypothetical protein